MLSRASLLRRALAPAYRMSTARRFLADEAVANENKLKFNFFLPYETIKSNAQVVRGLV